MLRRNFILAGALALALTGTAAPAQEPEAQAVAPVVFPGSLARVAQVLQQPFECDVEMKLEAEDAKAAGSGSLAFFTPRLFRFALVLNTYDGGEIDQSFSMLLIADDAYLNVEAEASDGKKAFKLSLDLLERMAGGELSAAAQGVSVNGWSPAGLAEMLHGIEFQETELEGGAMRVHATLTEVGEETLPVPVAVALDLDGETAFPRAFTVDAGALAQASITTNAVRFPEEMDQARFRYEPKDVVVMDLSSIVQMQLGMAAEDPDEF